MCTKHTTGPGGGPSVMREMRPMDSDTDGPHPNTRTRPESLSTRQEVIWESAENIYCCRGHYGQNRMGKGWEAGGGV